jgi:predicted CoA-binding protein
MIVTRPEVTAQIVRDAIAAGVPRVWMHQSMGKDASSVSPEAAEECRRNGVSVIAGACPMMFIDGADFGHKCMRWMLGLSGGLPP